MDVNELRSIVTVLSMLGFAGIVAWAWAGSNRERFEKAKKLPFADKSDDAAGESSS